MPTSRRILLNTNIALRYIYKASAEHGAVKRIVEDALQRSDGLFVTPQVLREFWAVATRPALNNGFGFTTHEAEEGIRLLLRQITLLDDEPGIFADWLDLVTAHNVKSVKVHDANHAAAARHHGLTHVLTLNPGDFSRYALAGLAVLTP